MGDVSSWSCVRTFLNACEDTPREQVKSLVISVSSKPRKCSWNALVLLPGAADKSESPWDYSFTAGFTAGYSDVFMCLYGKTWLRHMPMACPPECLAPVTGNFTHATPLNPHSINWLSSE